MTRVLSVALAPAEITHLTNLLEQFEELLAADPGADPALGRLAPDAYPDDSEASAEFRRLTRSDLFDRRRADASAMRASLDGAADGVAVLGASDFQAWMKTLAALRLVIADRLGIADEEDLRGDDPRFDVYEWLGYRLDTLVTQWDATA